MMIHHALVVISIEVSSSCVGCFIPFLPMYDGDIGLISISEHNTLVVGYK